MSNPSLLRQRIRQMIQRRFHLEKKLLWIKAPLVGASLVQYQIKCGKGNCSCKKGKGHGPYDYLSARVKGKTRLKLIPKEMFGPIQASVQRYRDYQDHLRLIRRLNKDMEVLLKRLRNLLLKNSRYRFP